MDLEQLIKRIWPPIQSTTVQLELDRVEAHYGLQYTHDDIEKAIGYETQNLPQKR